MKEHGGDLDRAVTKFGGKKSEWIDLSTGINPNFYPIDPIKNIDIHTLPSKDDIKNLIDVASKSYNTNGFLKVVSGAQAAINLLPYLISKGDVSIIEPTYNEYNQTFLNANWKVNIVQNLKKMEGSTIAIICNPNNPDGKTYYQDELITLSKKVGLLVIDESFMDLYPSLSMSNYINKNVNNVIILKSFGKFFGLAGVRLGFIISSKAITEKVEKLIGPWQVSNPAIIAGTQALKDDVWIKNNIQKLKKYAYKLDILANQLNWRLIGGTYLYRLYETENSVEIQKKLAQKKIWSRIFSYSNNWIRLGIPSEKNFLEVSSKFSKPF